MVYSAILQRSYFALTSAASLIGTNADKWAQAMLEARGIPGIRVLVGLLNLAHHYDSNSIDKAQKDKENKDSARKKSKPD